MCRTSLILSHLEARQLDNYLYYNRYKTCAMAAKEEASNVTIDAKPEETPDSTTEDAPTSLETIPEGNAARNELQTAPKDKSKSIISSSFTYNFTGVIKYVKMNFIFEFRSRYIVEGHCQCSHHEAEEVVGFPRQSHRTDIRIHKEVPQAGS